MCFSKKRSQESWEDDPTDARFNLLVQASDGVVTKGTANRLLKVFECILEARRGINTINIDDDEIGKSLAFMAHEEEGK